MSAQTNVTLHPYCTGAGRIEARADTTRLTLDGAARTVYSDAQFTDVPNARARLSCPWRPPLRLTVRARSSHPADRLRGTAGFGFWNHPLGAGLPRLPRALWFFYSAPPSNMALALGVPGPGWKAATFDATRARFYALLPFALPGFALMRIPALYRALWPIGQRALGVSETIVPVDMVGWHSYTLEWRKDGADFYVDGVHLHHAPDAPRGPLGFIVWLDNQCAVVTPQGRFGHGYVDMPGVAWLELGSVQIDALR